MCTECSCTEGYTGQSCDSEIIILYTNILMLHVLGLIFNVYFTDIDECATSHECSDHANCNDTDGSYWCECWSGFQGDGYNCTGQSLRIYDKSQC